MAKSSSGRPADLGLLVLRVGIGVLFIFHGLPKLTGGPGTWEKLGGSMAYFGVISIPVFWGFMSMVAEFFGGVALILGLFTRPAAALMFLNMVVATVVLLHPMQGKAPSFSGWSHPLALAVVFLSLIFLGAGRYNIVSLFGGAKAK